MLCSHVVNIKVTLRRTSDVFSDEVEARIFTAWVIQGGNIFAARLFRGNIFMTRLFRGKCAAAGFSGTMWRYRRWCISKGFDARGREREEAGVREFYNKSNSNDVKDEF